MIEVMDQDIAEAARVMVWNGEPDWIRKAARHGDFGSQRVMDHARALGKLRIATEALESIASKNIHRTWTATSENPETHWEMIPGFYAVTADAALTKIKDQTHDPRNIP